MKLTGKVRVDFEKWFNGSIHVEDEIYQFYLGEFDKMHLSMQWGVYVDFFRSVDVVLFVRPLLEGDVYWKIEVKKGKIEGYSGFCKTTAEARKAAIEKANELYNA